MHVTAAVSGMTPPTTRAERRAAASREKGFWSYLGTSLSAAVLVLVLALAVVTIVMPALVGGRPLTVLTQSMEPGLPPGTLLVIRPTPADQVRVGEVLTYQIESGKPGVVSHRVVSRSVASNGTITFVTKGDDNDLPDPDPVQAVQVVGTLWYSVPLLGWANNVVNGDLRSKLVPAIVGALFLYAAFQVFSEVRARRRSRAEKGSAAEAGPKE